MFVYNGVGLIERACVDMNKTHPWIPFQELRMTGYRVRRVLEAAILAFGLFAAASLSACVPPSEVQTRPETAELVVVAAKGSDFEAMTGAAAEYQEQSGQPVRVEALDKSVYEGRVKAHLISGSNRYDLVMIPAEQMAKWVEYRAVQPLDLDQSAGEGMEPWLQYVTFDGRIYGVPTQPDPIVLWYRADLLEAAGRPVPATWDEFRSAAAALNRPPDQYGAVIPAGEYSAGEYFSAVLAGFGGQAINESQQAAIDSQAARQALAFMVDLLEKDRVMPPEVTRFDAVSAVALLRSGEAAMGLAPLSAGESLLDCNASPDACREDRPLLEWAWLPGQQGKGTAGGALSAWVIPVNAANADAAQQFTGWLSSVEGAAAWAANGGIPANRAALADGDLSDRNLIGISRMADLEQYDLVFPPVAASDDIWIAYNQAVYNAMAGKQAPDQALEEAAQAFRQALRQGTE